MAAADAAAGDDPADDARTAAGKPSRVHDQRRRVDSPVVFPSSDAKFGAALLATIALAPLRFLAEEVQQFEEQLFGRHLQRRIKNRSSSCI